MGEITAIEPQKRRKDRQSIFVDGEFVVGAHEEVIYKLNLAVGQSFDAQRLEEVVHAETLEKARSAALMLLSYRDRTESEIRKRLIAKDYPPDIVDQVIEHVRNIGFIDDEKFSQAYVKARSLSKPMGRNRLAIELRARGIGKEEAAKAIDELDEDKEYELAASLLEGKLQKADRTDPGLRLRLSGFLARRGFGWDLIKRVMDEKFSSEEM